MAHCVSGCEEGLKVHTTNRYRVLVGKRAGYKEKKRKYHKENVRFTVFDVCVSVCVCVMCVT